MELKIQSFILAVNIKCRQSLPKHLFVADVATCTSSKPAEADAIAAAPDLPTSAADTIAAATDLPTGEAVAKHLACFDLAHGGVPLACWAGARLALEKMIELATNNAKVSVALCMYFQRYNGPIWVLDFLKDKNMADAKLVELICTFIGACFTSTCVPENCEATAIENQKLFVDLEVIHTFLLVNDEHFATNTAASLKTAASIWSCIWIFSLCPNGNNRSTATERELATPVTEAT